MNLTGAALDAIGPNLDGLASSILSMGAEAVADSLVDADGELREGVEEMVNGLGEPQAQLEMCLENGKVKTRAHTSPPPLRSPWHELGGEQRTGATQFQHAPWHLLLEPRQVTH